MHNGRISIAELRRSEIVAAAVAVINEQGIQNLSLSEIEKKIGMSRGQLTYYFKTKEDILLAVFDRLIFLMCEQHGDQSEHPFANLAWLDLVEHLLHMILEHPPAHPEFHALQYTFLSQIGHREDFRGKLAGLYEEWRSNMIDGIRRDTRKRPARRKVSPRALATLVQAILHGLAMQKAAEPDALNNRDIVRLCLDMLRSYLWDDKPKRKPRRTNKTREVLNGRHRK
jgi:AcrR family transcriptional regulator